MNYLDDLKNIKKKLLNKQGIKDKNLEHNLEYKNNEVYNVLEKEKKLIEEFKYFLLYESKNNQS